MPLLTGYARSTFRVLALAATLALASAALGVLVGDTELDRLQLAARYTARLSFALFAVAFGLGPWLSRSATQVDERERQSWLGFATAHTVHLGFVAAYVLESGRAPAPSRAFGGALGYAVVAALLVVFSSPRRANTPLARRITTFGGAYLGLIFVLSYLPRITRPADLHVEAWSGYAVLLAVTMTLPGLRWALGRKRP